MSTIMQTLAGSEVDAINVAPGMLTVNGVVLRVVRQGHVVIETPCTSDRHAPDAKVEVFGFVDRATLRLLQGDPLEELGRAYEKAVADEAEEATIDCGMCGMVPHHPRCRARLEAELEDYGEEANNDFLGAFDDDGAPCCRAVVTSGDPSQHEPGCHNDQGPEWRGDPRYES